MEDFLARVAEVLEVPHISADDDFRAVPMWSSLLGFGLLVMVSQRYGRTLSPRELSDAKTVADLATLAGVLA